MFRDLKQFKKDRNTYTIPLSFVNHRCICNIIHVIYKRKICNSSKKTERNIADSMTEISWCPLLTFFSRIHKRLLYLSPFTFWSHFFLLNTIFICHQSPSQFDKFPFNWTCFSMCINISFLSTNQNWNWRVVYHIFTDTSEQLPADGAHTTCSCHNHGCFLVLRYFDYAMPWFSVHPDNFTFNL